MLVATSSTRPRRMFTSPRRRFTVADAEAVAMTEIRLAAIASRMGTPMREREQRHQEHAAAQAEQRPHEAGGRTGDEEECGRQLGHRAILSHPLTTFDSGRGTSDAENA